MVNELHPYMPVSMGNPHCGGLSAGMRTRLNLEELGPAPLSATPVFPDRTNAEFVEVEGRSSLRHAGVGAGERGDPGLRHGRLRRAGCRPLLGSRPPEVTAVLLRGGYLVLSAGRRASGHIHMTGPAVTVFEGEWPETWQTDGGTTVQINDNFRKLPGSYLFSEIDRRDHGPTPPSTPSAADPAGHRGCDPAAGPCCHLRRCTQAVDGDGDARRRFRGYGPEQGYPTSCGRPWPGMTTPARGVDISSRTEIFVSDGAKSDCGNIGDIFGLDNVVAVCDPVYPVYVDTNAMAGRAGDYDEVLGRWNKLVYMPCTAENGFTPDLPEWQGGFDLPLLPQQPHRRGGHPGAAQGMGGLRQCQRQRHPLRRRL